MSIRADGFRRKPNTTRSGLSSLPRQGESLETFLKQLPGEMTRPSTLAGMAAGGLVFRAVRLGILGLAGRLGGRLWAQGLTGRLLSATVATAVEAPVFTQTARMIEPQSGDFAMGTLSAGLMMATLRGFGFLGEGAVKFAAGSAVAPWIPASFQLAGLHFHHRLERQLGWADPTTPEPGWAGVLGTLVQFHGMGILLRTALGAPWAAAERAADIKMEQQLRPGLTAPGLGDGLAYAVPTGVPVRGRASERPGHLWAMAQNLKGTGPKESGYKVAGGMLEGPAIQTPQRVFLWLWQNLVKTPAGVFFIELGSQKHLENTPEARELLGRVETKIREAFAGTTWDSEKVTNGLLSEILRKYPGTLWHIKKQMALPGYKVWVQVDADEGKLWNLALLDGADRPRQMLMTLPLGNEVLELKVDYGSTGLPVMEGIIFNQDSSLLNQIKSRIIENMVDYPGGRGNLDSQQVQKEVFRAKQFRLVTKGPGEMGLNIHYVMGDRKAQWEWSVPGFGSVLVLNTRYEDYRAPKPDRPPRKPAVGPLPVPAKETPPPQATGPSVDLSRPKVKEVNSPTAEPASGEPPPPSRISSEVPLSVPEVADRAKPNGPHPEKIQTISKTPPPPPPKIPVSPVAPEAAPPPPPPVAPEAPAPDLKKSPPVPKVVKKTNGPGGNPTQAQPAPTKPAQPPEVAKEAMEAKAPVVKTEPPLPESAEDWLQVIKGWPRLSGKKRSGAMRKIFFEFIKPKSASPESIHRLVLDHLSDLLTPPADGASFVMSYAAKLNVNGKSDVVEKAIPLLADPQGAIRSNALEVIRVLVPHLPEGQQIFLQKKLKESFERTREWNHTTTMVYQARRFFESPSPKARIPSPSF